MKGSDYSYGQAYSCIRAHCGNMRFNVEVSPKGAVTFDELVEERDKIVHRVNAHDDLVEALKKASDEIAGFRRLRGGYPEDNHEAACDTISVIEEIVDAALAKAKGDT